MIDIFGTLVAVDTRLAVLIVAVCIGGIVRGFTGFGSALIIIPALTIVFDPLQAVVMHSIMEIPVILGLAPTAIRHANRRIVVPMILMLFITTPIGAMVLSTIDVDLLKIVISFAVLGNGLPAGRAGPYVRTTRAPGYDSRGSTWRLDPGRDRCRRATDRHNIAGAGRSAGRVACQRHRGYVECYRRVDTIVWRVWSDYPGSPCDGRAGGADLPAGDTCRNAGFPAFRRAPSSQRHPCRPGAYCT